MNRYSATLLVLIFAILLTSQSALATQPKFTLGIKGGLAVSDLNWSFELADETFEPKSGFTGGAFIQYNFSELLGIQSGLNYSMKGTEVEVYVADYAGTILGRDKVKYTMDYLEIPFLFAITFPVSNITSFKLLTGPQFGFSVRSRIEAPSPSKVGPTMGELDPKSTAIDAVFGGGFNLKVKNFIVLTEFHYDHALQNVGLEGAEKLKTYSVQVGLAMPL